MLALTRKKNQTIVINGNIRVTVADIDRNQVKLAIDAPIEIPIHREELLELARFQTNKDKNEHPDS